VAADYLNVRHWQGDLYWIAGKDYDRCHAEFEYIAKAMLALGAVDPDDVHMPQSGEWHMKLRTGAIIKTWSLKDMLKVGSEAPDGIIICEVAQITHADYTRLCNRTAEKRGWVVGTGTFESSLGWFPELFKLYKLPGQLGKSFSLPSWSNKHIYPGLIHVKEMEIQDAPIYLWIDPGYAGAYAVEVMQVFGEFVHIVDEIYEQGLVTEQIITICTQKPWWKKVAGATADIYVLQHQAQPAVAEVWLEKAHLPLACQKIEEPAGRERLHTFLMVNPIDHQPRLFIDPKCVGLLSEFGAAPNPFTNEAAPYKWKEARAGEVIGQHPEDKNNHAIKALIYGLIDKFGYVTGDRPQETEVVDHTPRRAVRVRRR